MDSIYMKSAIAEAEKAYAEGETPVGAVIVRDGEIIATGVNRVTANNDPTAHAEVNAIRAACSRLASFKLTGCTIYTSCEPCPMCLSAIYWAGISRIFYGNTKEDAEAIHFGDKFIYEEIDREPATRSIPTRMMMREQALRAFRAWEAKKDKIEY